MRSRIIDKQSPRHIFAMRLTPALQSLLQAQRPRRHVVRVTCDEVHRAIRKPALRTFLRRSSESAKQRLRSHLHVATLREPFEEAIGLRANQRVPFRMRNDRTNPASCRLCNAWSMKAESRKIGKLDEQIILLIQRIAVRIEANIFKIFVAEMEIAAVARIRRPSKRRCNPLTPLFDFHRIRHADPSAHVASRSRV